MPLPTKPKAEQHLLEYFSSEEGYSVIPVGDIISIFTGRKMSLDMDDSELPFKRMNIYRSMVRKNTKYVSKAMRALVTAAKTNGLTSPC